MFIEVLKENQVFIFGSNRNGFHGAGSAGLACRGESVNTWRQDSWFIKAMNSPVGSFDRIGKWAVYGVGRGFQEGTDGKSYAIQTIERPGQRRSTNLKEIYYQMVELWTFAKSHSELEFIMTPIGCGYSGYTPEEMQKVLNHLIEKHGQPYNITNLNCYSNKISNRET